ncbi:ABC transporter permease [Streptomyces sp. NPDC001508]|uniref:ABC transporter permease n=1 Tax=Streptomyces sp. NPDC001508 TaxID=3154656 RepID=UPI00331EA22D
MFRQGSVARLLAQRVATSVLSLFIASIVIFLAGQLVPGDAASYLLGKGASPEQLAAARVSLHENDPAWARYLSWTGHAVTGDFGRSLISGQPVWAELEPKLRNSMILAAVAGAFGLLLWNVLGCVAATARGRLVDRAVGGFTLVTLAIPAFVVGGLLILCFALAIPLFPATVTVSPDAPVLALLGSVWLPAVTIAITSASYPTRTARAAVLDKLTSGSVETARLRGLSPLPLTLRHVLPQAAPAILTADALVVGAFVGEMVVVETLFNYPGIGSYLVTAVGAHDLPVVQATALLGTVAWIITNLAADALSLVVNPRLRDGIR